MFFLVVRSDHFFVISFNFVDNKVIVLDNRLLGPNVKTKYSDGAKALVNTTQKKKHLTQYFKNQIIYLFIYSHMKIIAVNFLHNVYEQNAPQNRHQREVPPDILEITMAR